jgi:hypothetical protein
VSREQWLNTYAEALGIPPPTEEEIDALLKVAAIAAHTSGERTAAPVACWLAAKAGRSADEALTIAQDLPRE